MSTEGSITAGEIIDVLKDLEKKAKGQDKKALDFLRKGIERLEAANPRRK